MPESPRPPDTHDRQEQPPRTTSARRDRRGRGSATRDNDWDRELVGFALGVFLFVILVAALAFVVAPKLSVDVTAARATSEDWLGLAIIGALGSGLYAVLAGIGTIVLHALRWPRAARGIGLSALLAVAAPLIGCGGCLLWLSSM